MAVAGSLLAGGGDTPVAAAAPTATSPVTRQDLVQRTAVDGTLGFGPVTTLSSRVVGTLTWLPAEGEIVQPGGRLYAVDARPVVLLSGAIPAYRRMSVGVEGEDVRQLEQSLKDLGYTGFPVDTAYTGATAAAVQRWQKALGVEQTGQVDVTDVVFGTGPVRIAGHQVAVGTSMAPGAPVLDTSGTTRVVTVALEVSKQALVRTGTPVEIGLPDRRAVTGSVTAVGAVAKPPAEGSSGGKTTIEVLVTLAPGTEIRGLDQAPVEVRLESERRSAVLTVPVTALLALAEGGYGVRVVEGGAMRTIPAELGMFAAGRVEIRSTALDVGMEVEVPAT